MLFTVSIAFIWLVGMLVWFVDSHAFEFLLYFGSVQIYSILDAFGLFAE